MVVWTILGHFGPAHFLTVPRRLPTSDSAIAIARFRPSKENSPVLPFLIVLKKARRTSKKTRICYPHRTPKIPLKGREKRSKTRNSSQGKKDKEFKKKKRKGRTVKLPHSLLLSSPAEGVTYSLSPHFIVTLHSAKWSHLCHATTTPPR